MEASARISRPLKGNEEQRLVRLRKDFGGGNVQTAYEYGYAFDGGRRWRKDYAANRWTWYPCGVACGAGELVEQQSDLTGGLWTTTALYLKGLSIVRRNSEYHHFDLLGAAGIVTDPNGAVVSNNLYDSFGYQRSASGTAQTRFRADTIDDEGLILLQSKSYNPSRGLLFQQQQKPTKDECDQERDLCLRRAHAWGDECHKIVDTLCVGTIIGSLLGCLKMCARFINPFLGISCWILCVIGVNLGCHYVRGWCDRGRFQREEECLKKWRKCRQEAGG